MIEFHYSINGEEASFFVEEEVDLGELVFEAEQILMAQLQERGLEIDPGEKQYLSSRISLALSRDLSSEEPVDLGAIKIG
jgi:hypothetical protein